MYIRNTVRIRPLNSEHYCILKKICLTIFLLLMPFVYCLISVKYNQIRFMQNSPRNSVSKIKLLNNKIKIFISIVEKMNFKKYQL